MIVVKHFNLVINFLLPLVMGYHISSSGILVKIR